MPKFKIQNKSKYQITNNKILVLVFVIVIFNLFCHSGSYAAEQFVYDAKAKRDPFIPLVTPDGRLLNLDSEVAKPTGTLNLEGIIYDEKGVSFAIVNGVVVKIGDIIEGNQVLKIESKKVIFIKDGNTFEQNLKEEGK